MEGQAGFFFFFDSILFSLCIFRAFQIHSVAVALRLEMQPTVIHGFLKSWTSVHISKKRMIGKAYN